MSFDKAFKNAKSNIKSTTDTAISNGMKFTVQLVPLENADGDFPESKETFNFLNTYITDTMKYRELNPKALEGMKRKWSQIHGDSVPFVPKLQPSEIIVVLIAPSTETVQLFCSVPKSVKYTMPYSANNVTVECNRTIYHTVLQPPEGNTVFKYQDEVARNILNSLKIQGIYIEDESDDEELGYNINDL